MAAGLSIRQEHIAAFAEHFEAAVCAATGPQDFIPETTVDAELAFAEITDSLLQDLERLEPYGQSNPEPVFLSRDVKVLSRRTVGEKHLKLLLQQGERRLAAIGFRMVEAAIEDGARIDILYTPEYNDWNGCRSIELRLRDFRHPGRR